MQPQQRHGRCEHLLEVPVCACTYPSSSKPPRSACLALQAFYAAGLEAVRLPSLGTTWEHKALCEAAGHMLQASPQVWSSP